jgi:hypothetical protein
MFLSFVGQKYWVDRRSVLGKILGIDFFDSRFFLIQDFWRTNFCNYFCSQKYFGDAPILEKLEINKLHRRQEALVIVVRLV